MTYLFTISTYAQLLAVSSAVVEGQSRGRNTDDSDVGDKCSLSRSDQRSIRWFRSGDCKAAGRTKYQNRFLYSPSLQSCRPVRVCRTNKNAMAQTFRRRRNCRNKCGGKTNEVDRLCRRVRCAKCTQCQRGKCIPIPGCKKDEEIDRLCLTVKCAKCTRCLRGGCLPIPGCDQQTGNSDDRQRKRQCSLDWDSGPCEAAMSSWAFDRSSKTCRQFSYGGCQGNGNRFRTEKECFDRCSDIDYAPCRLAKLVAPPTGCKYVKEFNPPEFCPTFRLVCSNALQRCSQPAETGPCKAAMRRYYYDRNSGRCQQFTYGGCKGNKNNFNAEQECQRVCKDVPVCLPRPIPPPPPGCHYEQDPPAPPSYCPGDRLVCDSDGDLLGGGEDNGLPGGDNNSQPGGKDNVEAVGSIQQCSLLAESGPCRAAFPKYHFDRRTNRCAQFTYGGCGGNANRFDTVKECESACKDKYDRCPVYRLMAPPKGCKWKFVVKPPKYCPSPEPDCPPIRGCSIAPDAGPCEAAATKYYFDRQWNACSPFTYGGCEGNENRFDTLEECQNTCANKYPQCPVADMMPPKEGCTYEDRFNPPDFCPSPVEVCPPFDPKVECRRERSEGERCGLTLVQRFVYIPRLKRCQPFLFQGCGGNRNNFESQEECQTVCAGL